MPRRCVAGASSIAVLAVLSASARAGPEPNDAAASKAEPQAVSIQLDVGHTGVTSTQAPFRFPLAEYWRVELGGLVSYPLIADGRVFVTVADVRSGGSTLVALDVESGVTRWTQAIPGTNGWSGTAYDSGRIFVVNEGGLLEAFDEVTGWLQWSRQIPNGPVVTAPPVAQAGVVYVDGAGDPAVFAYDGASGALRLSQGFAPIPGGLALGAGSLFAYTACGFVALDAATGEVVWTSGLACGGGSTPVYANGKVYVPIPLDSGNAIFSARTGAVLGTFEPYSGQPVVGAQHVYFQEGTWVHALGLQSQDLLWTFSGDGRIAQLPIKVNETLFVGSRSGELWGLDGDSGKPVWSTNVGAPIAANPCCNGPYSGLAESDGYLLVPAGSRLVAYHMSLATTQGSVSANLPQGATPPSTTPFNPQDPSTYTASTTTAVCDLRGDSYAQSFYFAARAQAGVWDVYATINGVVVSDDPTATVLKFSEAGRLVAPKNGELRFRYAPPDRAEPIDVKFNFSATTSVGGTFSVTSITENGCKGGAPR
jgi:outer membrane protein assembly factor BamB